MTVEILHISDVHLGYQQYGHKERFNDFGRAFMRAVDYAVREKVSFVLISGDLFHKAAIDPPTLLQAVNGLGRLRNAQITVLAIAGNHDRTRYRDNISWLDFLSEQGYLKLLRPMFKESGISICPWDGGGGAYVDIEGVRVYGIPYLGASIEPLVEELPQLIANQPKDGIEFTVLMAHFGLEGEMPGVPGGISHNLIADLRKQVDYLALGHWHKPFERGGWIYNPGSLESCSMDERRWKGGYYHVVVDTYKEGKHNARLIKSERRPFYRLVFQVDEYARPEDLFDGLREMLRTESAKMPSSDLAPVVEISLEGVLSFDRIALDLDHVRELAEETISPLIARPKNNTRSTEFEIGSEEQLSRDELERHIISDLIRRDARFRQRAGFWGNLMIEVKTMSLKGSTPEAIVETMRQRMLHMEEGG